MSTAELKVSHRGQMALPAATRRRWGLEDGGTVELHDLGDVVVITRPPRPGGVRAVLREALDEAGGYAALAADVGDDDPDLA
jgi:bifunctional DNA-binding transcriptional regulator/antitoxin component of YhaV-PrlF toxin-antitoxin module